MRRSSRAILLFLIGGVLVSQYQNCSNYSENTMNSGSSLASGVDPDPSKVTLSVKSTDLEVLKTDDQIQIGGICNTGGHLYNYIQYQLLDASGHAYDVLTTKDYCNDLTSACDAKCDNGRFLIVLKILDLSESSNAVTPSNGSVPSDDFILKITLHTYDGVVNGQMTNYARYVSSSTTIQVDWP